MLPLGASFHGDENKNYLTRSHPYQREKSNSKQHGEISECMLKVCQDIIPLSRYTVIEQCEWQAIEVAEAVLVWVVTVVPSLFTVHA